MVTSTCSLTLNGPGLSVNSHGRPRKKARSGSVAAMRRASGTTAICAEMAVIVSGSLRYQKNWLRNDRTTQDAVPSTHILNVTTGVSGESPTGTVSATCSTGEFSFSSPYSGDEPLPDVDGRTAYTHAYAGASSVSHQRSETQRGEVIRSPWWRGSSSSSRSCSSFDSWWEFMVVCVPCLRTWSLFWILQFHQIFALRCFNF